jgi:hypothetical protein
MEADMGLRRLLFVGCWVILCAAAQAQQSDHPFQVNSSDGKSSLTLGFLGQGQAELIHNKSGSGNSQDLFLRRFRLIASGKFTDKITFFVETDCPNIGKGAATGAKNDDRMFLQDVILTYKVQPEFQLDGGLLLLPLTHNSGQGATTLLTADYGPYSFIASDPTGSRVGRDYGLQARGYFYKSHFEYRLGVFQGSRAASTANAFRSFGRFVWYPFEAEKGFFYTGTTLGSKRILALGVNFDHQKDYGAETIDLFYDEPFTGKNSMTIQSAFSYYKGGATLLQLPSERVWYLEAGFYNKSSRLGPFFQVGNRDYVDASKADLHKYTGGLAYWISGHKTNVKVGASRATGASTQDYWQFVMQAQIYVY